MSIGTLLVLLGLILAALAAFAGGHARYGAYSCRAVAAAVVLVSFGVLLGAAPLVKG